jgi:hypothetical protein
MIRWQFNATVLRPNGQTETVQFVGGTQTVELWANITYYVQTLDCTLIVAR